MVALWGMSACAKRHFVAGGNKGNLQVYMQNAANYEAPFDVIFDDEVIPDQSRIRRPFIVNRTTFSFSGLLLAATSERRDVVLYVLSPAKDLSDANIDYSCSEFGDRDWFAAVDPQHRGIIEIGRGMISEKCGEPTDVAITLDERFVVVSSSKGYLCWFRVPTKQNEYAPRGTNALKGGPVIVLSAANKNMELVKEELVPLDQLFFIRRMRLRPSTNRHRAELYFTGAFRPQKVRDRAVHGVLKVVFSTDENEPKLTAPPPYVHKTSLTGANAITFNGDGRLLAVVSNERFLIMNPDTFYTISTAARFPLGHEVDTLPTTSAAFIEGDCYLAVGSGDYSVMIVPLRPAVKTAETLVKHALAVVFLPLRLLQGILTAIKRFLKYCLVTAAWSFLVFVSTKLFEAVGAELGLGKMSEL
eukprot:Gregarina_sp_Pseudo_9__85@NODE_1058_length_1916_cov_5_263719_g990_i0_p1_GENE_NODE_1058_length_1916_cov_5_263719_g990_i0NODE_1058_length_1916_cov_5_263719_g990_i0_p1_ORF_typecomplete_len416_score50_59ANAPC4_WD40/PF12894_7/2_9e02ANAPC4_WD40/PF12894_7/13ANAPC4_WD40/PF12894_7/12ANAPC4_WD40/PF12894_7/87WD40/PF00400_32/7_6e03WD40/PF00400_32/4_8e02WD40/PF00400_32/1_4e02WD40/PF00400_32/76_NODE_1058_length_1916_cov_5_263719_g990_i05771824